MSAPRWLPAVLTAATYATAAGVGLWLGQYGMALNAMGERIRGMPGVVAEGSVIERRSWGFGRWGEVCIRIYKEPNPFCLSRDQVRPESGLDPVAALAPGSHVFLKAGGGRIAELVPGGRRPGAVWLIEYAHTAPQLAAVARERGLGDGFIGAGIATFLGIVTGFHLLAWIFRRLGRM